MENQENSDNSTKKITKQAICLTIFLSLLEAVHKSGKIKGSGFLRVCAKINSQF